MYGFKHTARSAELVCFMYFEALLMFCYFLPNREIGLFIWGRTQDFHFVHVNLEIFIQRRLKLKFQWL